MKIRSLTPEQKVVKLSDAHGLYIEVNPNGRKTFRLNYRWGKKQKTLTIGPYPEVTLREAREKREQARSLLRQNIDPATEKRRQKIEAIAQAAASFEEVAKEFIEKKRADGRAESTVSKYEWCLEAVGRDFRKTAVSEITRRQAFQVVKRIADDGVHDKAKRTACLIKEVMQHAEHTGLIDHNPTLSISRGLNAPQTIHHAAITDMDTLGKLLLQVKYCGSEPLIKLGLRLLSLTALRPGEVRFARWSEFDFEDKSWTIPAQRMKMNREHVVPLSTQALEVLEEAKRYSTSGGYVFASKQNPDVPISENTFTQILWRQGWKGRHTPHGFRTSASTYLHSKRFDTLWVEAQLAHKDSDPIRAAYNRGNFLEDRREMMQHWADVLDEKIAKAEREAIMAAGTN
jgi:integrase